MNFKYPLKFSIVIPVYNEEYSVILLYFSLKNVMDKINQPYEIIFVDDYSVDDTLGALGKIGENLIIAGLNSHYGQSIALQAGFDLAQGEFIITMDGDLQDDPENIPKLLDKMTKEGYDIVCGWRYNRKDPLSKIFISKIAWALRRVITKEQIHDFGCTLRVFKKEILKGVYLSSGMHRFFALIMFKLGYKIGEIKIEHYPRRFGKSKYNIHNRVFECIRDFTRILLFGTHAMGHKVDYRFRKVIRK